MAQSALAAFAKPPAGTKLNYTHPLSNGCVGAWLFNEGEGQILNDAAGYNDGDLSYTNVFGLAPTWANSSHGPVLRTTDVNQYAVLGHVDRIFRKNAGETVNNFTAVYAFEKTPGIYTDGWAFGVRGTNTEINKSFGVQTPNADGDIMWLVAGSSYDTNIQVAFFGTYPVIGLDVWVFTNSFNRGMEIWKNGQLISYGLTKNPTIQISTNLLVIGDSVVDSGIGFNGADTGDHHFLYLYDRVLTPTEIASISSQPYQMFKKQTLNTVLSVGDLGVYNERGRSGAEVSGKASIIDNISAQGGAVATGTGLFSFNYTNINGFGGAELTGDAFNLRTKVEIATGGVELAGAGVPGIEITTLGGAVLAGTAPVIFYDVIEEILDGEGVTASGVPNILFLYSVIGTSAGIEAAGVAILSDILSARGGIRIAGEAIKAPGSTSANGTGGAVCSGVASINWYIIERIRSVGIELSGRAINIRRGSIQNVRIGLALAMKNDNIIKTNLAKSLEPVTIFVAKQDIPEEPGDEFRIEQTARWCYIEDCQDNVLPRITANRQNGILPPRIRNAAQRDRSISRAKGI